MPTSQEAVSAAMLPGTAAGQGASSRSGALSDFGHEAGSGADISLIDAYLQQLLPALAKSKAAAASRGTAADSLGQLGLSRDALLAAGLPQHTINALYRAMAAHAGAFRRMVAGEVKQLRSLLAQQAAPHLSATIQILDGPIAAAATAAGAPAGSAHTSSKVSKNGGSAGTFAAAVFPALAAAGVAAAAAAGEDAGRASEPDVDGCSDTGMPARAFSDMANVLSCLGPTSNELVKDYAEAYASMKDNMEIRLRHEQRRGDFLQGKLQQTEGTLKDTASQLDVAHKRIMDQRAEHDALCAQHAELQQSLAVSHAAHLSLQQHHQAQMDAWQTKQQAMEQQHKQQLDALQQELSSTSAAAAALVESNRQVEALRLLYNEELARASKLAVELSKATAAADKAAAQEAVWAKKMATSEGRADNAEGMATAMNVSVRQLEAQLELRQQETAAREAESAKLRVMLERARLTAVAEAAAARASTTSLGKQVQESAAELKRTTAELTTTSDQLKMCKMELEGANAQLQAGRSHMRQLMADLEMEQEKCAGLAAAIEVAKEQASTATSAAEVAEARLKSTQEQLGKANDAAAAAQDRVQELELAVQEQTAEKEAVQLQLTTTSSERAALQADVSMLRHRLSELAEVQQQFIELQKHDASVSARVSVLEEEHVVLSAHAEELVVVKFELQELRKEYVSLQINLEEIQRRMSTQHDDLAAAQAAEQASAAHAHQLQQQLEAASQAKQQLAQQLLAMSTSGDAAQQELHLLTHQMDDLQAALEASDMDRQALAAQRDGWMASFQEAYGKLQEWTVSSEAASHKLAQRAGALQEAMQSISSQAQASAAAEDGRAAAGSASRPSSVSGQAGPAAAAVAEGASAADAAGVLAAAAAAPTAAAASGVMDQLAGLQQLVRAEAHKQQEVFDSTLKALHDRVQERHSAAQSSWQDTMAAANQRRAARAAAKAAERTRKKQSFVAMAAANSHAAKIATAAMGGSGVLPAGPDLAAFAPAAAAGAVGGCASAGGPESEVSFSLLPALDASVVAALTHADPAAAAAAAAAAGGALGHNTATSLPQPIELLPATFDQQLGSFMQQQQQLQMTVESQQQFQQLAAHYQQQVLQYQQRSQQQAAQNQQLLVQFQALQRDYETLAQQLQQQQQGHVQKQAGLQQQQQEHDMLQRQLQAGTEHRSGQPQQEQQDQLLLQLNMGISVGLCSDSADMARPSSPQLLQQQQVDAHHYRHLQQQFDGQQRQQFYGQQQQQHFGGQRLHSAAADEGAACDAAAAVAAAIPAAQVRCDSAAAAPGSLPAAAAEAAGTSPEAAAAEAILLAAGGDASSSVKSAEAAAAPAAGLGASTGPAQQVQRVSSNCRVDKITTVTVITTSTSMTELTTELSSNSDGGGSSSSSSSQQLLTLSSMQQHSKASLSIETAAVASPADAAQAAASMQAQPDGAAGTTSSSTAADSGDSSGGMGVPSYTGAGENASAPSIDSTHMPQQAAAVNAAARAAPGAPGHELMFGPVAGQPSLLTMPLATVGIPSAGHGDDESVGIAMPGAGSFLAGLRPGMSSSDSDNAAGRVLTAPELAAITMPGGLLATPASFGATGAGYSNSLSAPFGSSIGRMSLQTDFRSGSFGSSRSSGDSPGGRGGSLSEFVSIATYQEQMQSVAKLHGQVGQLAVQLREAHADAEGAQQLLQQERQEATARTTALRDALDQLHGQLEDLREDHKQLQESHRVLMTKDLMNSGLLRDRYVADLFQRLQEALWKLDLARQRAATWGFDMLVPLGRANRGIQTQAGEIWASTSAIGSTGAVTAAMQSQMASYSASTTAHAVTAAGAAMAYAAQCSSSSRLLAIAGGELSAEADPEAFANSLLASSGSSRKPVQRKPPAFTQHGRSVSPAFLSNSKTASAKPSAACPGGLTTSGVQAAALAGLDEGQGREANLLAEVVELLLSGGVHLLSLGELLRIVASLYSSKAAADARALRSHEQPLSLWCYVLRQLTGPAGDINSSNSGGGSSSSGSEVVLALAQLLGSAHAHVGANKEVAAFEAALLGSIPHSVAAAAGLVPDRKGSRPGSGGVHGSGSTTPNGSAAVQVSIFQGTWGGLRMDDSKLLPSINPELLLPEGIPSLVQQVLQWPGMSALLSWVSGGHYLGGLGPHDLGKALLDVQAPHIHFLLLEAADILRIHPIPRVQVVQAPAPFARLLRIPIGPPPSKREGGSNNRSSMPKAGAASSSSSRSSRPALKCQRASLLVLSSAAMQLLQPAELQAAMAGALAPIAVEGAQDDDAVGPSSSSNSPQPWTAVLADFATLASLLALTPAFLLGHLPPEMHAMGGFLAAALLAVERLVGAVGDRASLVVCQDLGAALGALVKATAGGATGSTQQQQQQQQQEGGSADSGARLIKEWQQRVQDAQERQQELPGVQQLLPQHSKVTAAATASSSGGGGVGGQDGGQLSEDEVLLLRVRELLSWARSQQYSDLMAAARPLRRVVRPGSANSSRSLKSA